MIYTLTLNPAIDYHAVTELVEEGRTNRTKEEYLQPGGKGLNVAAVLAGLGDPVTAIALTAGPTGEILKSLLEREAVSCDFIELESGFTRINVKLHQAGTGIMTELNGSGIRLNEELIGEIRERLGKIGKDDTLVLSGSLPAGSTPDLYRQLMESTGAGKVVVDASGAALLEALEGKPYLIKPNRDELLDLMTQSGEQELIEAAGSGDAEALEKGAAWLQQRGAENVLVSMGGDGAFLLSADGNVSRMEAPEGDLIDAVGAGDSMVAGFLHQAGQDTDPEKVLAFAVAAGSATAFSMGLAKPRMIHQLYDEVRKQK